MLNKALHLNVERNKLVLIAASQPSVRGCDHLGRSFTSGVGADEVK